MAAIVVCTCVNMRIFIYTSVRGLSGVCKQLSDVSKDSVKRILTNCIFFGL